jgi:hypothetical protein
MQYATCSIHWAVFFMLQADGMTLHAVGTGAVMHAVCIVGHRAQGNKLSKTNSAGIALQFTVKAT